MTNTANFVQTRDSPDRPEGPENDCRPYSIQGPNDNRWQAQEDPDDRQRELQSLIRGSHELGPKAGPRGRYSAHRCVLSPSTSVQIRVDDRYGFSVLLCAGS